MASTRSRVFTGSEELLGGAAAATAALLLTTVLVPMRGSVSPTNVALVLMIPVLIGAAVGGRWAGAFGAVVATFSFDFFFTRPYLSLRITSAEDVETALTLFGVSLVAAELAIRSRRQRAATTVARSAVGRLERVVGTAAAAGDVDDVVQAVRAELIGLLDLDDCTFVAAPPTGRRPMLDQRAAVTGGGRRVFRDGDFELPTGGVELPVLGFGRTMGTLLLVVGRGVPASIEQRRVAVALADQLGVVLAASQRSDGGVNHG